jgi:hypothetical protein
MHSLKPSQVSSGQISVHIEKAIHLQAERLGRPNVIHAVPIPLTCHLLNPWRLTYPRTVVRYRLNRLAGVHYALTRYPSCNCKLLSTNVTLDSLISCRFNGSSSLSLNETCITPSIARENAVCNSTHFPIHVMSSMHC